MRGLRFVDEPISGSSASHSSDPSDSIDAMLDGSSEQSPPRRILRPRRHETSTSRVMRRARSSRRVVRERSRSPRAQVSPTRAPRGHARGVSDRGRGRGRIPTRVPFARDPAMFPLQLDYQRCLATWGHL